MRDYRNFLVWLLNSGEHLKVFTSANLKCGNLKFTETENDNDAPKTQKSPQHDYCGHNGTEIAVWQSIRKRPQSWQGTALFPKLEG